MTWRDASADSGCDDRQPDRGPDRHSAVEILRLQSIQKFIEPRRIERVAENHSCADDLAVGANRGLDARAWIGCSDADDAHQLVGFHKMFECFVPSRVAPLCVLNLGADLRLFR